jgi:hypothetical protein
MNSERKGKRIILMNGLTPEFFPKMFPEAGYFYGRKKDNGDFS